MKKKIVLFVLLLAGVFMVAQTSLASDGQSSKPEPELITDESTGKIFKADGKEWHVGARNINWNETQDWIKSLGGDWRTPTQFELKSLHNAVGKTSPIGINWVWAEKRDFSSAWRIDFFGGDELLRSIVLRGILYRAVAVRSKSVPELRTDENTGKIFKADGKEWHVGAYTINWNETQDWISSLGGGWRTPTRAELKSLHNAVGKTSPIGDDVVWAEKKNSSSAWNIYFYNGYEDSHSIGNRYIYYRAVAVR